MDNTKTGSVTSSMVELKAELFRKQEELKQLKAAGSSFVKGSKTEQSAKGGFWSRQNAGVKARAEKDKEAKPRDYEEDDVLAKSKKALEEKAKLYDKLCNSSTIPDEDGSDYYLVDFQKKAIDSIVEDREARRKKEEEEIEEEAEKRALAAEIPEPTDPDEEWIDFKDSFGRDRRCMKKDLDQLMKQDRDLALAQSRKKTQGESVKSIENLPTLMSSDMHREIMRQKWENEMKELQEKGQQEIHYSNVQFDEIRNHGVGFFQFSRDHKAREEQLEDLKKMREQTLDERSRKDHIKDKRKAMMEARLAKVRQRRNLKELPTEVKSEIDHDNEAIGPKLNEASLPLSVEDSIKKEEIEKQAEEKRKMHVREWDKDKERGFPKKKNYIESLREEREKEFAPPSAYFNETRTRLHHTPDKCSVKPPPTLFKATSPGGCDSHQLSPTSAALVKAKAHGDNITDESNTIYQNQETKQPATAEKFSGTSTLGTIQEQFKLNKAADNSQSGDYVGCQNVPHYYDNQVFHVTHYGQQQQQPFYGQDQLSMEPSISQQYGAYQQYNVPQQQQQPFYNQQQSSTQFTPNPTQQYSYLYGTGTQQFTGEAFNNTDLSSYAGASLFEGTTTEILTEATSHLIGNSISSKADSAVNEPKRPKIPKMAIMDTRYVKNEEVPSVDSLSGAPTPVAAIPYTSGSFTAAKQFNVKQYEDSVLESRLKNQISGTAVLYTAEQMKKQGQHDNEENKEHATGPLADKKIQDFLTSIRSDKNP